MVELASISRVLRRAVSDDRLAVLPQRTIDRLRESAIDIDRVELSSDTAAPVRTDLVRRIRTEIARGTYLTEERLSGAIDGLARDVLGR